MVGIKISQRETLDSKLVRKILSDEEIAQVTKTTEVETLTVKNLSKGE